MTASDIPDPQALGSPPAPSSPAVNRQRNDARRVALLDWLRPLAGSYRIDVDSLRSASDDASFRQYFRVDSEHASHRTLIVMDAPPPMEDCQPFVHAAEVLRQAGANVPIVHEADLRQGFLLLGDFGSTTYLQRINGDNATGLYQDANRTLVKIQAASRPGVFADYDAAVLTRELMLFPDWYLTRHRGAVLTDENKVVINQAFAALLANNLAQPKVFVHRDYHSRNLMLLEGDGNPGVLDFQDALYGPITYDLVSLLRDAYVTWEEAQVIDWAIRYWEMARKAGLPVQPDFGEFYRDFEWMGLQRQLKVLGIFARLYHRDGKDRYLADLPTVRNYVVKALTRYNAFGPLLQLLEKLDPEPDSNRQSGYTF